MSHWGNVKTMLHSFIIKKRVRVGYPFPFSRQIHQQQTTADRRRARATHTNLLSPQKTQQIELYWPIYTCL